MGATVTLWLAQGLLQPQEDLGQRLGSMIVSIWSRCFWTFPCDPKTFLKVHFPVDHPFLESLSSWYHLELIQSGLEDLDCQSFTADLELKLIKCQQVTAAALLPTSLQQPPPPIGGGHFRNLRRETVYSPASSAAFCPVSPCIKCFGSFRFFLPLGTKKEG